MPSSNVPVWGKRRPSRLLYLRSFLPIVLVFSMFATGLTIYTLLSNVRSPPRRLGWQAWDIIETEQVTSNSSSAPEGPSLRLDTWDPLAAHTTGLTEISIKFCLISPYLFPSQCRPETTPEEDKLKGQWVRVDPNLNARLLSRYLHVWYRRTRRLDAPLITDMKVLPDPPPADVDLSGWTQAPGNLHAGKFLSALRVWYKASDKRADNEDIITEISVHYGGQEPFFGFERVDGSAKIGGDPRVDLVYRRGNPEPPKAKQLTFGDDGMFKIMQIADLHYSVGKGECRDTSDACEGDQDTATWLGQALDAEKPGLVVFSGDQLNGQGTSFDARSVLAKFAAPVIERKIPWAAVFGNHDSEIAHDRADQMRALMHMPYSLARAGPADAAGVGNYDLRIYSNSSSPTHLFTLYFLDSHSYKKKSLSSPMSWIKPDYDYIKKSQVKWYLSVSSAIEAIQRPFRPSASARTIRPRGPQRLERQTTRAKPNAMMFFHIPLREAYDPGDTSPDERYHGVLELGSQLDGVGAAKDGSELFPNGIQKAFEGGASDVTEVKVLSHGHCHNTDRCRRVSGVWMCFDGGSSFSGYGSKDFSRRVRLYNISDWGETIQSYKRLTGGEIIDRQALVGSGAPEGWGQEAA